jgi:hypothetical protein
MTKLAGYADAGTYSIVIKPYTYAQATLLASTFWATVTVKLVHPCDSAVATVPTVKALTYVLDQKTALTQNWAAFTFTPTTPCNDGTTIAFPTHYTGTWARTSPKTAFTTKENLTPPIKITSTAATSTKKAYKSWVVSSSLATYKGVYSLTLTAKHGTVALSKAQVITLNIVDQCDAPAIVKPANPAASKYVMNAGKITYFPIKIITATLSKIHDTKKQKVCKFTYTITVPTELKKVATYDAAKGVGLKALGSTKPGKYSITVQAKVGTVAMTNGKYTMTFNFEKAPENKISSTIT